MNAGVWWEITDGNGTFWRQRPANVSVLGHGPLAEVERMRPVVEAAEAWQAWVSPAEPLADPVVEGQARVLYGAVSAYRAGGSAPHQGATTDVTALQRAVREIEAEATGSGLLQPGAAFALGCLGEAGGVGPGWTADDLARALAGAGGTPDETGHHPR